MYHCRCRALTKGHEPVYFTVKDVPVRVYPDIFTLASRPGTPLLQIGSVCRAMDHVDLGEGDRVLIDGLPYTVSYYRGFLFKGEHGTTLPSNVVDRYTLITQGNSRAAKLQFKYGEHVFQLFSFLGCMNGKAVLSVNRESVDPGDIQVSAGFNLNKKRVFYGDCLDGAEIIMWRGRPCILKGGVHVEVPTGQLLGGDER